MVSEGKCEVLLRAEEDLSFWHQEEEKLHCGDDCKSDAGRRRCVYTSAETRINVVQSQEDIALLWKQHRLGL